MKQFDLDEYISDPSKKVITRDGKDVRILCTDKKDENYPIVALIDTDNGEELYSYTKRGTTVLGRYKSKDLFFAPVKYIGWMNVVHGGCGFEGNIIFSSKEDAERMAKMNELCVATIKVEFEY